MAGNLVSGVNQAQITVKPVYNNHTWTNKNGRCSKVVVCQRLVLKSYYQFWKAGDHASCCRQVVVKPGLTEHAKYFFFKIDYFLPLIEIKNFKRKCH